MNMDKETRTKYKAKAKDSFKTKKNLFIFQIVINKKSTFSEKDFEEFSISNYLIECYTSEYWQQLLDYKINNLMISDIDKSISSIEKAHTDLLTQLENKYINTFSNIFPEDKFVNLLNANVCHYCKISKEMIEKLADNKKIFKKTLRGWKLEIDRKNSNFEYRPDNCVMSCYWCNNAKTDEFTELEFLKIGEEIGNVWKNRLNDFR